MAAGRKGFPGDMGVNDPFVTRPFHPICFQVFSSSRTIEPWAYTKADRDRPGRQREDAQFLAQAYGVPALFFQHSQGIVQLLGGNVITKDGSHLILFITLPRKRRR